MCASIDSKVSILLSINSFIFEYSSRDSSNYHSKQIYITYDKMLLISLVSLIYVLYSFMCSFLVISIIGKTNSLHNFITKYHNYCDRINYILNQYIHK